MTKLSLKKNIDFLTDLSDNTVTIKKGAYLYRKGDASTCIMFIFSGSLKTVDLSEGGKPRIKEFLIKQDVIGLDAMMNTFHSTDAIAIEDSIVKAISYEKFSLFASRSPEVIEVLESIKAEFMTRKEESRRVLDNLRSESKLASFLMNLTTRMGNIGYSFERVQIKMTHKDIANFLGVKGETISRAINSLKAKGTIHLKDKTIEIVNMQLLKEVIRPTSKVQ
jgi:CRP/FNR family transcriptional regulator